MTTDGKKAAALPSTAAGEHSQPISRNRKIAQDGKARKRKGDNSLLIESGTPGGAPEGNCETKCSSWLRRCNDYPTVDPLQVLGQVIQSLDLESNDWNQRIGPGQERIRASLAKNQFSYQMNGFITLAGTNPAAKSLADYFKASDFSSIEAEFQRAISHVDRDPHAAITAACAIVEALCKTYIEMHRLAPSLV